MNKSFSRWAMILASLMVLVVSCAKERVKSVAPQFVFKHSVNGYDLQKGVMNYTNQAGNLYEVDELQYFISEVSLHTADGQILTISADSAIHYIDINTPSTLEWNPKDRWPVTDYSSITFVFGINETKNKTGYFVNPPQRDMFWPDILGGGYHYMKMNGKWQAEGDTIKAFNMHLGIGTSDYGTSFVQNYFTVTLPLNIHAGTLSNVFTITMDIEKWFAAPNVWNWNVTGGSIMENQVAMHQACENGANVFHIAHEGKDIVYHD